MPKSQLLAVYNSRIFYMVSKPPRLLRAACLVVVLALWLQGPAQAADWEQLEQKLATQLAGAVGGTPVSLEVSNRSSLSASEVDQARGGLQERLAAAGLKLVNATPGTTAIHVFLSEDLREWVWVGEVEAPGRDPAVVMATAPRADPDQDAHATVPISLRKLLLCQSQEPILNAAIINGALPRMAVLLPDQIKLYRLENDHWIEEQALPVAHSRPWPRELRGRLVLHKDRSFEARLPGTLCQSNSGSPLSISCSDSDDPWPIGTEQFPMNAFFAASRNFFTGVLAPGIGKQNLAPAFYSAAPIPGGKNAVWFLATVDGRLHLLDGTSDTLLSRPDWGSDLATVHSACGSQWQILAAGSGTGGVDTVRAYELHGREPVALGQAVEFSGGVTSLWTAPDGQGVVAVVHNGNTGGYEAYLLTMACSQ